MPFSEAVPAPAEQRQEPAPPPRDPRTRQTLAIVLVVLTWTFFYNLLIKGQSLSRAFFTLLDTISDDFVMGSFLTLGIGLGIVILFSVTKLYGQIVSNIYSFKMIEDLIHGDLREGRVRLFFAKLLNFRELPRAERVCPERISSILISFSIIYLMSWVYVILYSEALFFFSWSSGVNLPVTEHNIILMPTLALAIPFSARVMAYVRYPYAQDYADFMPAAAFVFIMVTFLGFLFQSPDQAFFLARAYEDDRLWRALVANGVFLAFIPVFFEAVFWVVELYRTGSGDATLDR